LDDLKNRNCKEYLDNLKLFINAAEADKNRSKISKADQKRRLQRNT
jgi:hypothetical protein